MRNPLRLALALVGTLTVQPALAQYHLDKIFAHDASDGERMGLVSSDGDTLAVGLPLDSDLGEHSGSVYLYGRSGEEWVFETKLHASDGAPFDRFGTVSLDGDTLAVSAYWHDGAALDAGAVYIFERVGTTWIETQVLTADDAAPGDSFGLRIQLAGDLLVVGAPYNSLMGFHVGCAYVFRRQGSAWVQEARLNGSVPHAQAYFGNSVATDGATVVIGAFLGVARGISSGAAHVFRREASTWIEEARLIPSDAQNDDRFGIASAVQGDTVAVGAFYGDAAYVFTRDAGVWTERVRLEGSDVEGGDFFGQSLDLEGDRLVVGAPRDDEQGTGSGATYAFTGAGGTWAETAKIVSPGPSTGAFGTRVELDGYLLAITAPFDDEAAYNAGAIYVFTLGARGEVYCTSTANSTGQVARIWMTGSASVLRNDTGLHVSNCPPGAFGLFVYGTGEVVYPLGNGILCVSPFAPGLHRLMPAGATDATGRSGQALDMASLPPGGTILAGTTQRFQYVLRDVDAGQAGFNLSEAMRVAFVP